MIKDKFFKLLYLTEVSFIVFTIFIISSSWLIDNIADSGLLPDTILVSRFIIYILFLAVIFCLFLLNDNVKARLPLISNVLKQNYYNNDYVNEYLTAEKLNYTNIFLIISLIIILYFSIGFVFNIIPQLVFLVFSFFYIYILFFNFDKTGTIFKSKFFLVFLFLLTIFVNLIPHLRDGYINSESYPNKEQSDKIIQYFIKNKELTIEKPVYTIPIKESEYKVLKVNSLIIKDGKDETLSTLKKFTYLISNKILKPSTFYEARHTTTNNRDEYSFTFFNGYIEALCLLGNYDSMSRENITLIQDFQTFGNVFACINELQENRTTPDHSLSQQINKIPFITVETRDRLFELYPKFVVEENKRFVNAIKYQKEINLFTQLVGNKGLFFHHYNSIIQTINTAKSYFDFGSNQYGFGPLFITEMVHKITKITLFDAVFASTLFINGLILLILIIISSKLSHEFKAIMFISYITSILTTYLTTDLMAPFLYYIRYLPSVLLALLMFHAISLNYKIENSNYGKYVFFTILILISIYNFEYAIFTVAAIGATSMIKRNKFYFISSVILFSSIIFIKIISHLYLFQPEITVPVRYMTYFSQWGAVTNDYRTLTFLLIVLGLTIWLFKLRKKIELSAEYYIIFFLLLFLNIKVVWNFAFNHIGPLFLLAGLVIISNLIIISKQNSKTKNEIQFAEGFFGKKLNICLMVLICLSIIPNTKNVFLMTEKIHFEEYSKSLISSKFSIAKGLLEKLESAKKIYRDGDLIISPIDNSIAIFLGKKVTKPFADLSTNINYNSDIPRISRYFLDKSKRIIVDEYIDRNGFNNVIQNWSRIPRRQEYFKGYSSNLKKFRELLNTLMPLLYKCDQNQHFTVYCFKN
jgi:hypothetical protein